jgi:hypothetical protein
MSVIDLLTTGKATNGHLPSKFFDLQREIGFPNNLSAGPRGTMQHEFVYGVHRKFARGL